MTIFVSRAGEDSAQAQQIAAILTAAGHTVIIQDADFQAGSFPNHIKQAIDAADRFLAVYSPRYFAKPFCLAELNAAFARDPIGEHRFLIPVLIEPCTIPYLFQPFIYVEPHKDALLAAISAGRPAPKPREIHTSIQHLPTVNTTLFGRGTELNALEQAFTNPDTNFLQIIAPGGTGKTALMSSWYRRHRADVTIFGWSFYSQGTGDNSNTTSEFFFNEALPWFGITVAPTESAFRKVDLLVDRLRHERVLLILDGVEPLQDPEGTLRDLPLKALLQELAVRNPGLVLVTTRVPLTDVPDDPPHALSVNLENLAPDDGAAYLQYLGVHGELEELRAASESYGHHALALTLLGTYLKTFCNSDLRRITDIKDIQTGKTKPGRHARKVMATYARMYLGKPELDILRALGYFNRPAEPEALKLVMPAMDDLTYKSALQTLRDARLILTTDPTKPLDCHPLIREHFAEEATREGHTRLYEHYKNQSELTQLFHAVYHGCRAGKHAECCQDVYRLRILRGREFYLLKKLGAFGTNLSLLANFFETPWIRPVPSFTEAIQAWLISVAASTLHAVGRLADAVEPMQVAAESAVQSANWKKASLENSNLSELHLTLGNVAEAVSRARQCVDFADRSGDEFERISDRTALADALHRAGDLAEATQLLAEAERLQAEHQPNAPILDSLGGYRYCDLLLAQGHTAEVLRRASQNLHANESWYSLLSIGLDHLSLGRAHPSGSPEATDHLDQAVDFLRRASMLGYLPLALLARATPSDLAEAFRIATRSGMRLHLADYHLISARQALAAGDRPLALDHFHKAETLIAETGYHRRDPELAALRTQLH